MNQNQELLSIVNQIKSCCSSIFRLLEEDIHTKEETINHSGDIQATLDVAANEIFINTLKQNKNIKYLASEESPEKIDVNKDGKYIVVFDPLDGSGNIDVQLSLGSIFAIFKDDPKSGRDILFAGYCLYTYKCIMVYTFGNDIVIKEYILEKTFERIYYENLDNISNYCCINNKFNNFNRDIEDRWKNVKNYRWTGCMVSDVHRCVINTGYFCYPGEKLRLLYECYPMAFVISNLGGKSNRIMNDYSLGENILDIPYPKDKIHQKIGILIDNPGKELKRG